MAKATAMPRMVMNDNIDPFPIQSGKLRDLFEKDKELEEVESLKC
jgi:hypothetical protein